MFLTTCKICRQFKNYKMNININLAINDKVALVAGSFQIPMFTAPRCRDRFFESSLRTTIKLPLRRTLVR